MTDNSEVLFDVTDGIATITINRPEQKNAMNVAVNQRLTDLWEEVDSNPEIRVAILTATQCGVFCAGMDLKEAAKLKEETGKDILEAFPDAFQERMRKVKKPIIAALSGHLMAGGMLLALNSDLRIGLAGTKVGITEVKVGRGSPWASPALYMLPQPILMELVVTGELLPIEQLAGYGFCNYVEDTIEDVIARAHKLAAAIVKGAPLSVKAAKASVLATMDLGVEEGLKKGWDLHQEAYNSLDAIEGPRAFAEKRAPNWQGK